MSGTFVLLLQHPYFHFYNLPTQLYPNFAPVYSNSLSIAYFVQFMALIKEAERKAKQRMTKWPKRNIPQQQQYGYAKYSSWGNSERSKHWTTPLIFNWIPLIVFFSQLFYFSWELWEVPCPLESSYLSCISCHWQASNTALFTSVVVFYFLLEILLRM